jgi:hypothetical protein
MESYRFVKNLGVKIRRSLLPPDFVPPGDRREEDMSASEASSFILSKTITTFKAKRILMEHGLREKPNAPVAGTFESEDNPRITPVVRLKIDGRRQNCWLQEKMGWVKDRNDPSLIFRDFVGFELFVGNGKEGDGLGAPIFCESTGDFADIRNRIGEPIAQKEVWKLRKILMGLNQKLWEIRERKNQQVKEGAASAVVVPFLEQSGTDNRVLPQ